MRKWRTTKSLTGVLALVAGTLGAVAVGVAVDAGPAAALSLNQPTFLATLCFTTEKCGLTPIDQNGTTFTSGTTIALPEEGYRLAVTPNGRAAFVTGGGGGDHVVPVDLGSDTSGKIIDTAESGSVAITPGGKTAYVDTAGTITPIDTATDKQGKPVSGPYYYDNTFGLAVSPDGSTLYSTTNGATDSGNVVPIPTSTDAAGTPIEVTNNGYLESFAITPDGSTLYAADPESDQVFPVDLATQTAGGPITLPTSPLAVAVTPDGSTVLTADSNGTVGFIPIGLGYEVTAVDVCPAGDAAEAITVSPDANWALVDCYDNSNREIVPLSLETGEVFAPITLPSGTISINDVVAVPDQAPAAALTVAAAPAGSATSFDASQSGASEYPVTSYAWNFGDGNTATTSTPTTTHTYAAAGSYDATVTETDAAGTSTAQVFTGQTVSDDGGPGAVASAPIRIATQPCTQDEPCTLPVTTPSELVTVSGTPSGSGASLSATSAPGTIACAPGGFTELGDVTTYSATSFGTGKLTVTDVVSGVTKAAKKKAKVCFQGTSGGPSYLPKCSADPSVACLASATFKSGKLTLTMDVPANDPRFHCEGVDGGLPNKIKPTVVKVGKTVTITGSGLEGATSVSFSGPSNSWIQATIASDSSSKITVTVPAGATTGPLTITWPGETAVSTTIVEVT